VINQRILRAAINEGFNALKKMPENKDLQLVMHKIKEIQQGNLKPENIPYS